ncbi:MAG: TonB-dependent receptor [Muribaculaceae bacterium]
MKKIFTLIFITLSTIATITAQEKHYKLQEVTFEARRPLKDIGVVKTSFDSLMLKENIALSMADILTYHSGLFVKNYGRATLSTVSFRGTSPSHTQVSWNGIPVNSPMLGMTDFSLIPAYFIDDASLLHGASSVSDTGGGLGGMVNLATRQNAEDGIDMSYIQGLGSFSTFDEFLKVGYKNDRFESRTRVVYSSSKNDFEYTNHDKKLNVYDENKNIIGQYYPKEKNVSGAFHDFHALQEFWYDTHRGDAFSVKAWYMDSNRELPLLSTDYGSGLDFENRQREHTLRLVASWNHRRSKWQLNANAGYVNTWLAYDYKRDNGSGEMLVMTCSRNIVNSYFGHIGAEYNPVRQVFLSMNVDVRRHDVNNTDNTLSIQSDEQDVIKGYERSRTECSVSQNVKWQPNDYLGFSAVLREDVYGEKKAVLIPALTFDGMLYKRLGLMVRGSVARNYRFPSLNDLYFFPGGNPKLKSENGHTYDCGVSFDLKKVLGFNLKGSINWFESWINDWILWLPTTKGFFSPRNVKKVHSYGIEANISGDYSFNKDWKLDLDGNFSWTPSINEGEPMSPADRSIGKQLPYVPEYSSAISGRLSFRTWAFQYKWCYYSRRYTMSSGDVTLSGRLPEYFMSNVSIEKKFVFKPADLSLKLAVNNLFNEDYISVLSRPMPGINFEFFIGITPKF